MSMTKKQEKDLLARVNEGERPMKVARDLGISRDDMRRFRIDKGPFIANGRTARLINLKQRKEHLSTELSSVQAKIKELERA